MARHARHHSLHGGVFWLTYHIHAAWPMRPAAPLTQAVHGATSHMYIICMHVTVCTVYAGRSQPPLASKTSTRRPVGQSARLPSGSAQQADPQARGLWPASARPGSRDKLRALGPGLHCATTRHKYIINLINLWPGTRKRRRDAGQ